MSTEQRGEEHEGEPAPAGEATGNGAEAGQVGDEAAPETGTQREPERPRGRGLAALALVLALIAVAGLGAGGYFGYRVYGELDSDLERLGAQAERAAASADEAAEAVDRIDPLGARIDSLSGDVEQLTAGREDIEAALDRLRERVERNRQGWVLAESEYLMRLASRRLHLARDVETALAALRAADARLAALDDPALTPVRQRLGEEIEALRSVPRPDLTGLASRLAGLEGRVGELPLDVAGPRTIEPKGMSGPEPGEVEGWRGFADAVWSDLKGLVVVRRHERPVEPMLPPDQQYFLEQNLRLKLESARLALLRDAPGPYRESLDAARGWIERYFETGAPAVESALASLRELADADLRPELPDVTGSLRALEQARERLREARAARGGPEA